MWHLPSRRSILMMLMLVSLMLVLLCRQHVHCLWIEQHWAEAVHLLRVHHVVMWDSQHYTVCHHLVLWLLGLLGLACSIVRVGILMALAEVVSRVGRVV